MQRNKLPKLISYPVLGVQLYLWPMPTIPMTNVNKTLGWIDRACQRFNCMTECVKKREEMSWSIHLFTNSFNLLLSTDSSSMDFIISYVPLSKCGQNPTILCTTYTRWNWMVPYNSLKKVPLYIRVLKNAIRHSSQKYYNQVPGTGVKTKTLSLCIKCYITWLFWTSDVRIRTSRIRIRIRIQALGPWTLDLWNILMRPLRF